jgi:hypothetical protein
MYRSHPALITRFNAVSRHVLQTHLPIDEEFTGEDSVARNKAFVDHCTSQAPAEAKMSDYTFELVDQAAGLVKGNIKLVPVQHRSRKFSPPPAPPVDGDGKPKLFSWDDTFELELIYTKEDVNGGILGQFAAALTPNEYTPLPKSDRPPVKVTDYMDPGVDIMFKKLLSVFSPDVDIRENAACRNRFTKCIVPECNEVAFVDLKCILHSPALHDRPK